MLTVEVLNGNFGAAYVIHAHAKGLRTSSRRTGREGA
jgi:hypothetical protein